MPISRVFGKTDVLLHESFPVLDEGLPIILNGLIAISDFIPLPAGSIVKGLLSTTKFVMDTTKQFSQSKRDIYLLSARSAQVVTAIVNEIQSESINGQINGLMKINKLLEDISVWVQGQTLSREKKFLRCWKASDTIDQVRLFNQQLDQVIALFGLEAQIATQKTVADIQNTLVGIQALINKLKAELERLKSIEMIQYIVKVLPPKVDTLDGTEPPYLPGTRLNILKDVEAWLESRTGPSIYWLTGVAGCGKSTISRRVTDTAREWKFPCSWFYFSRTYPDRQSSSRLLTTAALHLVASKDSTLIQNIHDAVHDGIDGSRPLLKQMDGFLNGPVQASGRTVILVWDALDECTGESRQALLTLLSALPGLPPLTKIFLTSRPESDFESIRERLGGNVMHRDLTYNPRAIPEDDTTLQDINCYLIDRFEKMADNSKDRPGDQVLSQLNHVIDGLFMIAQFVCDFIAHGRCKVDQERLDALLKKPDYGRGGSTTSRLYSWYSTGLDHLFRDDSDHEKLRAKVIMALILGVHYPLSLKALAVFLGRSERLIKDICEQLSPFLVWVPERIGDRGGKHRAVRFVHQSMSDFFGSQQARDFRIKPVTASAKLAAPCLKILSSQISKVSGLCNSTGLSDQHRLASLTIQMPSALAYACQFWGYHLKDATKFTDTMRGFLNDLLFTHFLKWLQLVGRLDMLDAAISCLEYVTDWELIAHHSNLTELSKDGIQFINNFRYALRTSLDMETDSLYFTPANTLLYKIYASDDAKPACIVGGRPQTWSTYLGTLEGHTKEVCSVAFSPDGNHIVSGSLDNTVRIWDASTGLQVGIPLTGHTAQVWSVAFSPCRNHIVSGSWDGTVRIWDAFTGSQMGLPLNGHTDRVWSVAYTPDGNYIVSGSSDHTMRIWDALTGEQIGEPLMGHTGTVVSVTFSPDGARIVSGSSDNTVRIWERSTGLQLGLPLIGHTGTTWLVGFIPNSNHIVSASSDNTVQTWDISTGLQVEPSLELTGMMWPMAFSPQGNQIVSGSFGYSACIWNVSTGSHVGLSLKGHKGIICSAFSPNSKVIATGSSDHTVRIWDASSGLQVNMPLKRNMGRVGSVAFSPDGKNVVSGSSDHKLRIWDASTGCPVGMPLKGHTDQVHSVAFSSNSSYVVSASLDNTVRVWNAKTGVQIGPPLTMENEQPVKSVSFSPDGTCIMSISSNGTTQVWDASTRTPLKANIEHGMSFNANPIVICPDGWLKTKNGHQLCWLPDEHRGEAVAWSDRSQSLVVGSDTGLVTIIRLTQLL